VRLQVAGGVSGWRLGVSQGEKALRPAAQAEGAADSVDLSERDDEEPAAVEVSICVVDSRDDPHVDLEKVSGEVEFGFGGSAFGAIGSELPATFG
jgi:hypothetical protein